MPGWCSLVRGLKKVGAKRDSEFTVTAELIAGLCWNLWGCWTRSRPSLAGAAAGCGGCGLANDLAGPCWLPKKTNCAEAEAVMKSNSLADAIVAGLD